MSQLDSLQADTQALDNFPFRKLPPELQLKVFQALIGKPPNESPGQRELRRNTRTNMLRLDKGAYESFAAEFYKQAKFRLEEPHRLINTVRGADSIYLQNMLRLYWKLRGDNWINHEKVTAWVDVLFTLPKLSAL